MSPAPPDEAKYTPLSMRRIAFLLLSIVLLPPMLALAGCGGAPALAGGGDGGGRGAAEARGEQAAAGETAEALPERAFPEESLHRLLAAEFALRRGEYAFALAAYLEEAERLRDAGVSAHATRIAQFVRQDPAALQAGRLWAELAPGSLEARLTLANLLAQTGRIMEALPQMEAVVRAGGVANFTALARGVRRLPEAEQAAFRDAIHSLLAEFPDNSQLRICHALLLEAAGRAAAALRALQPVFKDAPFQAQAVVLDAKLRVALERRKPFRRLLPAINAQPGNRYLRTQYARLLARIDLRQAQAQFQQLADAAPQDPELLLALGLIQRENGDFHGARNSLEGLLATGARADQARYYLGRTAEDLQERQAAVAHYMEVPPGEHFGAALERIADLLLADGQTAEQSAERTPDERTDDERTTNKRAAAEYADDERTVAERAAELSGHFDRLRRRHPRLEEQLFAIENRHLIDRQLQSEAAALLDRALTALPDSTHLRYSRSRLREQAGQLALAEEDLRNILRREPDNAAALNALGYMLANRTRRYAEAEALIERALALMPDDPAIMDSMGWVNYHLGRYADALDYLQRAYAALPDPEVASHLGEVLWRMGRAADAKLVWKKALEADPEHAIIMEAVRRLGAALEED